MDRRMLAMGTLLMLFLGLIYAWSLFAAPLEQAFGWSRSQTAVTFSISMTTFCLGSIGSGLILKKHPPARILLLSAALFLLGFFSASRMTSIWGLYLSYGVLCGLGVGLSYNAILATVPKWYPGRAGFVTGALLMGMGLGSLILGTVVNRVMEILMWATTFRILAVVFFLVFVLGSFNLSSPKKQEQVATGGGEDYSLPEMLKTGDFWLIFIWATIASAVGLGIVSNASYMAQELGVTAAALPLVVGMVSVGNGVGRLIFGAATDKFGGKKAMVFSNLVYATGLALAILASKKALLFLIAAGFVLIGVAFGAPSTVSAALVKKNFGEKYYPQNLSAVVLVLIPGSLIGPTIAAGVYQQRGNYFMVYLILLALVTMAFLPALIFKGKGHWHSSAGSNNGGEGKGKQEVWS